jgi:chromosome segregation ATPase
MTIDERIEYLMQSTESHDRQIGELTEKIGRVSLTVETLSSTMGQLLSSVSTLASTVGALADVANNHERESAVSKAPRERSYLVQGRPDRAGRIGAAAPECRRGSAVVRAGERGNRRLIASYAS